MNNIVDMINSLFLSGILSIFVSITIWGSFFSVRLLVGGLFLMFCSFIMSAGYKQGESLNTKSRKAKQ